MSIPFNKPYVTGKENTYIAEALSLGKLAGDGQFTKRCHTFFEERYKCKKAFLTTSCTDALELAALLIDLKAGDEVIAPSYTFVSTVNAFVLRGAKIVFADSTPLNPNIDPKHIEKLITPKTKAIVLVHYAGIACDMDAIMKLADKHGLFVIEDAAQAIDSYYKGKALGTIGHLGAFSFHETKNIIAGEGGMLLVNDERFIKRAEIIREKGTNRSAFFRGEVDRYNWVDVGSSFLPSELIAAFLYAQLENIDDIQEKRKQIWERYYKALLPLEITGILKLPQIPDYASNNAHVFFILTNSLSERSALVAKLKDNNISAVFHYISLHNSPYMQQQAHYTDQSLPHSEAYTDCLLRLPLFYELSDAEVDKVTASILEFYSKN